MGNRRRQGYILIATCAGLVVLTGIAGIAVDVGRLYIAKSEVQSFADSAAVAAALQLDGTAAGVGRAQAALTNTAGAMKWDMATKTVSSYRATFAQGLATSPNTIDGSSWSTNPADAAGYRFAKVTASVAVPLTFIRMFVGLTNGVSASSQDVNVAGTAGQMLVQTALQGLLPFSPIAPDPDNANGHFGFTAGEQYTMRYPPGGKRSSVNICTGDRSGSYWKSQFVDEQETTDAATLDQRVREDSDPVSPTYAQYTENGRGNYRRIVALRINNGGPDFDAIAIGAFFLLQDGWYANADDGALCAEYIGPYVQGSPFAGAGTVTSNGFVVRLVR